MGHKDGVQVVALEGGQLAQDLCANGALPCNGVRVIVGGHKDQAIAQSPPLHRQAAVRGAVCKQTWLWMLRRKTPGGVLAQAAAKHTIVARCQTELRQLTQVGCGSVVGKHMQ